jgi:hypothetical protein
VEYVAGVAGLLFFSKIIAHLYLLSKIDDEFSLLSYGMYSYASRGKMMLPVFEDVPQKYVLLKKIINVTYFIAVAGIFTFLIWNSFFRNFKIGG